MSFSVDGTTWPFPCDVQRNADMVPSDISGRLLDKSYFNDVIGTYMNFTVTLAVPLGQMDVYTALYEKLTAPIDGHSFTFPYNSATITITGRVENVKDVYKRLANGSTHWTGIQFDVTANAPTKQRTLQEAIDAGFTPYPDIEEVGDGEIYEYTEGEWNQIDLRNADEEYF